MIFRHIKGVKIHFLFSSFFEKIYVAVANTGQGFHGDGDTKSSLMLLTTATIPLSNSELEGQEGKGLKPSQLRQGKESNPCLTT